MCCYRRVCNYYTLCGHSINLPEELLQCDNRWCKFSTTHPHECSGSDCKATCWQYRQFPQQYGPHIKSKCPPCQEAERNSRRHR